MSTGCVTTVIGSVDKKLNIEFLNTYKLAEKGVGRGWHKQSDSIVAYLPPLFDDRTDREPFFYSS